MLIEIVAMDLNRCIGKQGRVPFDLPDDRIHFKDFTTKIGTVVPGSKTQKEIRQRVGGTLPDRRTIVLSHNPLLDAPGCEVFTDYRLIVEMARKIDICVIGGGEIYKLFLPHAHKLVVTHVCTAIDGGDTYFPFIDPELWIGKRQPERPHTRENQFPFYISEYTRKPRPH